MEFSRDLKVKVQGWDRWDTWDGDGEKEKEEGEGLE